MIPKLDHTSDVQSHYLHFLKALKSTGFEGEITPDYALRTVLSTDNSIYQILPQGVVAPKTTQDLVRLCELASQPEYRDIVLAPRGGGTGTNGQSLSDGIVVDLSIHMNQILEINTQEGWVRVQAGVVKDQLNAALKPHGYFFAPELSTSNRATIGGMINTDASGQGSCLYGKTRDHVISLKTVVLGGDIILSHALSEQSLKAYCEQQNISGLIHRVINNIHAEYHEKIDAVFPPLNRCLTGYDLAHIRDENQQFNLNNILCGSEGTLGFISEAKLNLVKIPKYSALVVVNYAEFDYALRDAPRLMAAGPTSIETIDSKILNLAINDIVWEDVKGFFPSDNVDRLKGMNLVEYTANDKQALAQSLEKLIDVLKNTDAGVGCIGHALAWGDDAVKRIWGMRKRSVGLLGNMKGEARPVPFVEDTAVPPEKLADFIAEFRAILDSYGLEYGMFGHVDAGVLHVRPALDMKEPSHESLVREITNKVVKLTQQYGGLLWGEHGKGVRSEFSPEFFGELYPQLQRIKATFDPYNQLNPGKIATPSEETELLKIDEVVTRGSHDRKIPVEVWQSYDEAVHCNGNGACYNWDFDDPMCPSWKATRNRVYSPKGRATLMKEWIRQLGQQGYNPTEKAPVKSSVLTQVKNYFERRSHTQGKNRGDYDFSHEVMDAMSTCLACKSCTGQCPVKVDVPEFRSRFLSLYYTRYTRPLKDHLVANLELLLPIVGIFPRLYNFFNANFLVKRFLEKSIGFADSPMLSTLKFNTQLKKLDIDYATISTLTSLPSETKAKTVIIVLDAFTRYFDAKLVIAQITLFKKLGFHPMLAPFKANGKALHVHGFLKKFKKIAKDNTEHLNKIASYDLPLVGTDPAMTLTYRSEYKKALGTEATLPKVMMIQEFLTQHLDQIKPFGETLEKKQHQLFLHCTEKTNAPESLAQWCEIFKVFNQDLKIINTGCCGMSGTFGHETQNLETSKELFNLSWRQKLSEANINNANPCATGYSCRSQCKREMDQSIEHPISVLLATLE